MKHRQINIPPPESAVTVRASLSAVLNHMLQLDLAFFGRQGIVAGLRVLHLKKEVIVLVRLIIVVAALLDLSLAVPSVSSATSAPAISAVDSPVGVVAKVGAALGAVSFVTFHQMSGVLRDMFKVKPVFGDIVLICVGDGTSDGCCRDGHNSEEVSDLHDALVCKDWNWIVVYVIVRIGRC